MTTSKNQNPPNKADAGKALVYFLQDDPNFNSRAATFDVGSGWAMDWRHERQFLFLLSVDPGEHHLCTNWQGFSFLGKTRTVGALHFTAEPGGVYYFRAKDIYVSYKYFDLKLKRMDSDEGQLLVGRFAFCSSHPKK